MNIIKFLKSRIGAVSKVGMLGTSISVGLMGLTIHNYMTSSPSAQDRQVRSLSSIMVSGGELPREYSGINVSTGGTRFATAEERAAREGTLFDGGDAAEAALDGLNFSGDGGVINGTGPIDGRALAAGEAGLGMAANRAAEVGGSGGRVAHGAQKGDLSGVDGATQEAAAKGKTLSRAAVAHASGTGISSVGSGGSNGGSGISSGVARSAAAREGASRIGASSISGAMPGGSTLVAASPKFQGAHSSSFVDPNGRKSRVASGINSEEGKNLRLIAKQSADVAGNAHRAANEGASPFMADQKLASGITVDDGMVTGSSFGGKADASFSQAADRNIGDLGAAVDDVDTKEQERKAKRTQLGTELVALFFATLVAMMAISTLMQKGEMWSKVVAAVLGALMLIWIGTFMARAGVFAHDYDNDAAGIAFCVLGGVFAVGIAISYIPAVSSGIAKKIVMPMAKAMGGGAGSMISMAGSAAVTTGVDAVKNIASGIKDTVDTDGSSLSNDEKI